MVNEYNYSVGTFIYIMYTIESVKPHKGQICDHLVRSRDELSKCPNTKALPTDYLKQSAFIKHLLIYLIQKTKVFNCGLNAN